MPTVTTERRRPIVYISGPYRSKIGESGVWENIMSARQTAQYLLRNGYAPICPHLNTMLMGGSIVPGDVDAEVDAFLEADAEFIRAADAVWLLRGWPLSAGSLFEIEVARRHGKPLFSSLASLDEWFLCWRSKNGVHDVLAAVGDNSAGGNPPAKARSTQPFPTF